MARFFACAAAALLAGSPTTWAATISHDHALVSSSGDRATIPGWHLQSTKKVNGELSELSLPGVDTSGWHRMGPRGTVMAGLVESGVYDEESLFYSDNLVTLVDNSPFDAPWIYREEFTLKPHAGQHYFLETHGISSRADIYVNGKLVASKDEQVGSYAGHKYDVTEYVDHGRNCILVQAYPTNYLRDFAMGFIDWNPYPADNGTGVWRNIEFSQTGHIAIMGPTRVVTDFKGPEADSVKATVKIDVRNVMNHPVEGKIQGHIQEPHGVRHGIPIHKEISLEAKEERTISVDVIIENPKIWWPALWGEQPLYKVSLEAKVGGSVSDAAVDSTFGINNVESEVSEHDTRSFTVNGLPFLVMGAGYTSHIFLELDMERAKTQFQYVLDMGLNTIRLEGKQEHPELYDLADEMGLMLINGWDCCDKWEGWEYNNEAEGELWDDADYKTAGDSMLHEAGMMQRHPSALSFLVGSDFWPDDRATKIYVDALNRMDWRVPIISSAAKRGFPELLGPSGMDMYGPYDWVPPNYWYTGKRGAAIGFGGELGSGVGTPGLRSMRKFLSPEDMEVLWTEPDKVVFHGSREGSQFDNRHIYNEALFSRYGAPHDLEDYLLKTQLMDYEATRSEFESYSARKSEENPSTGLIYWMLNGAWPSLHWSLFDYYMNPIASYFGTKVGTRTEHVAYDYENRTVFLINHSLDKQGPRSITIDLIDMDGKPISSEEIETDTSPNSSKRVGKVSGTDKIRDVAFLKLTLTDSETGDELSRAVHWLAPTLDVLDFNNSTWYYTPVTKFVDFTPLSKLSTACVEVNVDSNRSASDLKTRVTLKNKSDVPAFFLRLAAIDDDDEEVAPVFWSDNYVTLWPHEELELDLKFEKKRCGGIAVEVKGYNVETTIVDVC